MARDSPDHASEDPIAEKACNNHDNADQQPRRGLRKAGATIAAENGATDNKLMAIFGWTTKKQTSLYTKKADRKRLAGNAAHKLIPEQMPDKIVPPEKGLEKSGAKIAN